MITNINNINSCRVSTNKYTAIINNNKAHRRMNRSKTSKNDNYPSLYLNINKKSNIYTKNY